MPYLLGAIALLFLMESRDNDAPVVRQPGTGAVDVPGLGRITYNGPSTYNQVGTVPQTSNGWANVIGGALQIGSGLVDFWKKG